MSYVFFSHVVIHLFATHNVSCNPSRISQPPGWKLPTHLLKYTSELLVCYLIILFHYIYSVPAVTLTQILRAYNEHMQYNAL